jgi:hypothetical protein
MSGQWTEEDDRKLWSLRAKPTSHLAATFGRKDGAVRSRLKHLQDPTHKAYLRFVGGGGAASRLAANAASSPSSSSRYFMSTSFASSYKISAAVKNGSTDVIDLTSLATAPKSSHPAKSSLVASAEPSSSKLSIVADPSSLNADQKAASEYVFFGGNVFLTGAAGVGKSYLLNYLICGLRKKFGETSSNGVMGNKSSTDPKVVVAASTGIAATHINGVTIHSWATRAASDEEQGGVPAMAQGESSDLGRGEHDRWHAFRGIRCHRPQSPRLSVEAIRGHPIGIER